MGKVELILIIVLLLVLLFAGSKKLPELARGIGEAGKELRKGFGDDDAKKDNDKDTKK